MKKKTRKMIEKLYEKDCHEQGHPANLAGLLVEDYYSLFDMINFCLEDDDKSFRCLDRITDWLSCFEDDLKDQLTMFIRFMLECGCSKDRVGNWLFEQLIPDGFWAADQPTDLLNRMLDDWPNFLFFFLHGLDNALFHLTADEIPLILDDGSLSHFVEMVRFAKDRNLQMSFSLSEGGEHITIDPYCVLLHKNTPIFLYSQRNQPQHRAFSELVEVRLCDTICKNSIPIETWERYIFDSFTLFSEDGCLLSPISFD